MIPTSFRPAFAALAGVFSGLALGGCASRPAPTSTGFLSDYSTLQSVTQSHSGSVSPRLGEYSAFLIEPVQVLVENDALTPEEQTTAAEYIHATAVRVIESEGLALAERPGPGVARVRLALTAVSKSVPWQKIHPGARFAGAGTGGAAMEGEVVDSLTGEQLAAVVRADSGNQFNLTAFSTLDDVKGAVDKWAAAVAAEIREGRAGG